MIGTLSARNPITFGTNSVRIRQDLDIIGTQSARNGIVLFFPNHARSSRQRPDSVPIASRQRPDNTGQCYDLNPTQQNLSRQRYDCNPTRHNRLSLPNGTGRTLLSGVFGRPSRFVGLCYDCTRLRPDNDTTLPITPDCVPTFSFFVS